MEKSKFGLKRMGTDDVDSYEASKNTKEHYNKYSEGDGAGIDNSIPLEYLIEMRNKLDEEIEKRGSDGNEHEEAETKEYEDKEENMDKDMGKEVEIKKPVSIVEERLMVMDPRAKASRLALEDKIKRLGDLKSKFARMG